MNNSPITSKIKTKHINLKQNWRVAAITATSCINLIYDMALAPSELNRLFFNTLQEGILLKILLDSRGNIEKEDQTSMDPSFIYYIG